MLTDCRHTVRASNIGYMVQAMINTFAPLLFVTFQTQYSINLLQISILIGGNFAAQIILDLFAALLADKTGYRKCVIAAHVLAAVGILGLAFFPEIIDPPFFGLLLAVVIYGAGGGLTEVLLTPIVQACPIDNKDRVISSLHSWYCWGSVGVILISAAFFHFAGIENWKVIAIIWALIPIANAIYYSRVPMYELVSEDKKMSFKELAGSGIFWMLLVFMFCAGSAEMSIAQWASDFAEEGLHVTKVVGDLAGPCTFAAMKGVERTFYGKKGDKIPLWKFMMALTLICAGCYVVIGLSTSAELSLAVCAVAGFANGVMWPGTFSLASRIMPNGGTAMFGFLALFGDLGCGAGPMITGAIANGAGGNLSAGFLYGTIFSVIMAVGLIILWLTQDRKLLC